jgi:hypothetical protein
MLAGLVISTRQPGEALFERMNGREAASPSEPGSDHLGIA